MFNIMPELISLAYGDRSVLLRCRADADFYRVEDPVERVSPDNFSAQLKAFLDRADMDLERPAIVVADKTRLCGYPEYLPILLDSLVEYGADSEAIKLYIAYGTHLPQSDEESSSAYGPSFNRYQWVHHHCDGDHFVDLGKTSRGTLVRNRTDIDQASCVITFGAISHHYFAGYGGGRKLIFPGLGKKEDIYANHGLFLDRGSRSLAAGCRSGQIEGNPLAEDLAEFESFCPADMAIHGIMDSRGRVCELLVGGGEEHFRHACNRHAAHCEVATDKRYDLVVASSGGFPKDINFIQSHKAIHHAAEFVRDGGRLIVFAQCRDGIGSQTFLPWFELGGWDEAFDRLATRYMGNGGTALAMMAKLKRIKISMVTDLSSSLADLIGFETIDVGAVQTYIDRCKGNMAVIPNSGLLVRKQL